MDASRSYQKMDGVGAALTDASAWLLQKKLSAEGRAALLRDLFSPEGAGLDGLRLPMGASDFALSHYSYDNRPAGQTDPDLTHFSIEHDRASILPVAREALAVNPELRFMASPWSAPGWMKTSGSLYNGKLNPAYFPNYATYLRRVYDAYRANGVPLHAMTVRTSRSSSPAPLPA